LTDPYAPKIYDAQARASKMKACSASCSLHRALIRLKTSHRFLPRSAMGKAIDYALGQWSSLLVFLEDGRLEIDNNLIYAALGINQVMPLRDLCRVAA